MFTSTFHTHPTDQALIANFRDHQADFNQLLQMFQADADVGRIAPDFTDKPIPLQRWNEFRRLFRGLGVEAGMEGYGTKEFIWFHASASGLATSGSSKGYVYTVQAPKPVVDDLDTASSEDGEEIYRQIEGSCIYITNGRNLVAKTAIIAARSVKRRARRTGGCSRRRCASTRSCAF